MYRHFRRNTFAWRVSGCSPSNFWRVCSFVKCILKPVSALYWGEPFQNTVQLCKNGILAVVWRLGWSSFQIIGWGISGFEILLGAFQTLKPSFKGYSRFWNSFRGYFRSWNPLLEGHSRFWNTFLDGHFTFWNSVGSILHLETYFSGMFQI